MRYIHFGVNSRFLKKYWFSAKSGHFLSIFLVKTLNKACSKLCFLIKFDKTRWTSTERQLLDLYFWKNLQITVKFRYFDLEYPIFMNSWIICRSSYVISCAMMYPQQRFLVFCESFGMFGKNPRWRRFE
jgi:hypothetical protein